MSLLQHLCRCRVSFLGSKLAVCEMKNLPVSGLKLEESGGVI